jgi:hypothetical protein
MAGYFRPTLETSALAFAAAVRADGAAHERQDMTTFFTVQCARVELLVDLAADAIDTWEPDLAMSLLRAAWRAIHNVGSAPLWRSPMELPPLEEHEVDLRRRVRAEAARLFIKARMEEGYADGMRETSVYEVQAFVHQIDRSFFDVYQVAVTEKAEQRGWGVQS